MQEFIDYQHTSFVYSVETAKQGIGTSGISATLPRVEYCRYGDIPCDQSQGITRPFYFRPGSQETA
ncbi:TPA: hypothetical protein NJT28_001624 [Corynebacterium striatum]|nr:hypothetical protein [Corynebacterium striatum]